MAVVLGIDAAWTARNPSGIAVAVSHGSRWHLHSVWPSYTEFLGHVPIELARDLLLRVEALIGVPPDLVTVDMPMSHLPITGRREADNAVSCNYGGRWASTHTPSVTRPGKLSDVLRTGFQQLGYDLRTVAAPQGKLAEVYPHPALIEYLGVPKRLPYKVANCRRYWPDLSPALRRDRLLEQWRLIHDMLETKLPGTCAALPPPERTARIAELKSFEDQIESIVCASVGIDILENRAAAYGNAEATVWIPSPLPPAPPSA